MVFVDQSYISIARKTEITYHERKVSQLERTIKQLTEALAWEHRQHRSRLLELVNVESHISPLATDPTEGQPNQSTLKPLTTTTPRWSQTRKHHRHHSNSPVLHQAG